VNSNNRWKYLRTKVEPWDVVFLDKAHNCPNRRWLSGPEGGCSQMFMCDGCEKEFMVHPGQVEEIQ
jgi:hypothetical protein